VKKFYLSIIFLLPLICTSLVAQKKINLTLEQCIKLALENNHDLKQVKLDKEKADEQIRQAFGESVLPSIEGIASYNRALKRPEFSMETPFFSGTFPSGTDHTLTTGIQLEQPLFTGAMFLSVKIAKTYAEIANYSLVYSQSDLILKVKDAYYTYLLSKEFVTLAELQLKRAEENFSVTKAMYNTGKVSEYDFIRADVQYKNYIPGLTEAKNQVKLAANNLKILLGLNLDNEVVIDESLTPKEFKSTAQDEGIKNIIQRNPLLKQMNLKKEFSNYSEAYQFTRHLPEVTIFGNWQSQAQENNPRNFFDWRYKNSFSMGLNLRVPIFKGFSIDSKVQQAQIDLKKADEDLIKTKNNLLNDLENTLLTIQKTKEQSSSYQAAVDQTEKGYQIAQKRYSSGMSSQLEITDALVEVTRAKVNYLNSLYQLYVLHARLDLLFGLSLDEISH